jgi:hypothetical protein
MSITRQEPVPVGMLASSQPEGALGGAAHYDGDNPPSGAAAVPLRELMDDRLLDALAERSRMRPGGCG